MILLLSLLACAPGEVTVQGHVLADRADDAPPLVDGTVAIRDFRGQPYDQANTNADGAFVVQAPKGQTIHAVVDGPGLVPASFLGQSGHAELLVVPAGLLHGFTADELADWRARFAGCPGVDAPGGVFLAEVRYFLTSTSGGDPPPVRGARLGLTDRAGEEVGGCYLDEEGEAWDPDATEAGPAQILAAFGLAEGVWEVTVRHEVTSTAWAEHRTAAWIADGALAPRFPLWVELPIPQ